MCVYRASIASRTPAGCAFSGLRLCPLLAFCHLSRNCILGGLHCPRLSRPSRASPKDKKKGGLVCAVPRSSPGWLSRGFTRNMQAARERRCNGMVHTLSPASLPAGAITRRTQELNGVDADMAIRIAALTKVAFKGKLPPQPPPQQPYRKNGLTHSHPPTVHTTVESRVQKTQASPTPAPLTILSTPHSLISRHCSTLVHSRNSSAEATHTTIDHKLSSSLNRLRQKQLVLTQAHARRQIEASTHEQTLSEAADETKLDSSHSSSLTDTEGSSIELPFSPSESKVVSKTVCDTVRSLQHHLECLLPQHCCYGSVQV